MNPMEDKLQLSRRNESVTTIYLDARYPSTQGEQMLHLKENRKKWIDPLKIKGTGPSSPLKYGRKAPR
jgi:hypothetical protein